MSFSADLLRPLRAVQKLSLCHPDALSSQPINRGDAGLSPESSEKMTFADPQSFTDPPARQERFRSLNICSMAKLISALPQLRRARVPCPAPALDKVSQELGELSSSGPRPRQATTCQQIFNTMKDAARSSAARQIPASAALRRGPPTSARHGKKPSDTQSGGSPTAGGKEIKQSARKATQARKDP